MNWEKELDEFPVDKGMKRQIRLFVEMALEEYKESVRVARRQRDRAYHAKYQAMSLEYRKRKVQNAMRWARSKMG